MRKCFKCGGYTLGLKCPKCGVSTSGANPPKFSMNDKNAVYRRTALGRMV